MTVDRQQGGAFQHSDEAVPQDEMDCSWHMHSDRGASVFIGYIRSHARSKAEVSKGQENWQQLPPTAA